MWVINVCKSYYISWYLGLKISWKTCLAIEHFQAHSLNTLKSGVTNLWYAYHQWYIWTFSVLRGAVHSMPFYAFSFSLMRPSCFPQAAVHWQLFVISYCALIHQIKSQNLGINPNEWLHRYCDLIVHFSYSTILRDLCLTVHCRANTLP